MSRYARWLRGNQWARVATIVITFLLPLTNVVSGAILMMTARWHGWRTAAVDIGASLALLGVLVTVTSGEAANAALGTAALGAGTLWGCALFCGLLLRRYGSVALAVQGLVVMALLGVLAASLAIPDAQAHWQPVLEALIKTAGLPQMSGLPAGWLAMLALLMHGVIAASLFATLITGLMLALWLDRDEKGDSDWRRQFLELRLGRVLSAAAAGAGILLLAGFVSLGGGALLVLGAGFIAQGLAIIHWTADDRGWSGMWPLALYGPLLLGAPLAGLLLMALAIGGLVDNIFGLRRRRSNVV